MSTHWTDGIVAGQTQLLEELGSRVGRLERRAERRRARDPTRVEGGMRKGKGIAVMTAHGKRRRTETSEESSSESSGLFD